MLTAQLSQDPIVIFDQVTFHRGGRAIFDRLDMEIQPGKITAILGPSGTGKTTLLRLIGGLLQPDSGEIIVMGKRVSQLDQRQWYQLRRDMAMLFQSSALFTDLSVFDNVAFPLRQVTKLPESLISSIVLMKLEAVGLRGARDLFPAELSGGMARRVSLARSIALDPKMLMYDEPFTGQDPFTLGVLLKLIKTLNTALGMTSLIVTHDVNEVFGIADDVIIVNQGKVVTHGEPKAMSGAKDPWVDQFVHGKAEGPVSLHFTAESLAKDFLGVTNAMD